MAVEKANAMLEYVGMYVCRTESFLLCRESVQNECVRQNTVALWGAKMGWVLRMEEKWTKSEL